MATAGLIGLPTELVLKIVRDPVLTQEDLYSIAILSRRLNSIVIPVLFELIGLSDTQDTVKLILDNKSFSPFRSHPGLPDARKPITPRARHDSSDENSEEDVGRPVRLEPAIMVAFQLSSIRNLVCTLPQTFTDLSNLNLHLSRIRALLSCMESMGTVSFHFTGDNRYRHLKSNPLSAVPLTFADMFGDIIKLLVTSGCGNISLYNSSEQLQDEYRSLLIGDADDRSSGSRRPIAPPTAPNLLPASAPTKRRGGKNIFSRAKSNLESAFSKQPVSSNKSRKPHKKPSLIQDSPYPPFDPSTIQHDSGKLEKIHIQTPFALLPRCLPFVRDAIHSSINSLTSITLSYIFFDESLFDSCLSSLCFDRPNAVTDVRILHCYNLSPKSLLSFLGCFRENLEYLELDWNAAFIRDDEGMSSMRGLRFRNLETIIAPLDWIVFLLGQPVELSSHKNEAPNLPKLSTMTIQCRLEDSTEFKYNTFAPYLDKILRPLYSQRFPSSRRTAHPKIQITLDIILDRNRPFQLDLDTVILNYTLKSPPRGSNNGASSAPRPPKHWDLISKLNLSPIYPPATEHQAFALAQWVITVFPAVKEVTLPLPFIPRLMPIEKYKSRQRDLVVDAAVFLAEALRLLKIGDGRREVKWNRLIVGPWTSSLEED